MSLLVRDCARATFLNMPLGIYKMFFNMNCKVILVTISYLTATMRNSAYCKCLTSYVANLKHHHHHVIFFFYWCDFCTKNLLRLPLLWMLFGVEWCLHVWLCLLSCCVEIKSSHHPSERRWILFFKNEDQLSTKIC